MYSTLRHAFTVLVALVATKSSLACSIQDATYRYSVVGSRGIARFEMIEEPSRGKARALALSVRFTRTENAAAYGAWLLMQKGEANHVKLFENTIPNKPSWEAITGSDGRDIAQYPMDYFSWNDDYIPIAGIPGPTTSAPKFILIPALPSHMWSKLHHAIGFGMFVLDGCSTDNPKPGSDA